MLDARRLDLERPDPVPGGDDHVVGATGVPEVAVLVDLGCVLRVEPLAAEHLPRVVGAVPVAERVVGVRAGPQADLPTLARRQLVLVLVEHPNVPAGNRPPHRALAHLGRGEVAAERVALR